MEELLVKIQLMGQQLNLTRSDFQDFRPLLTHQSLQLVLQPLHLSRFIMQTTVLNSCLYYLVAVWHNVVTELGACFRGKCLSMLGNHYLDQKMHFELYQYSFVCSNILGFPLDKTIHMLYFLVYGRLATKPFVNNMIMQAEKHPKGEKRTRTKIIDQDSATDHQSSYSRHMTIFSDSPNYEVQQFQRELIETLRPSSTLKKQSKKVQKELLDISKVPQRVNTQDNSETIVRICNRSKPIVNVPMKVTKGELSSMIAHFKQRTGTEIPSQCNKASARRQKFNEHYDGFERLQTAVESSGSKENRCLEMSLRTTHRDFNKSQSSKFSINKHSKEFFKKLATGLKNQNSQLDEIRGECVRNRQLRRQKRKGNSMPTDSLLKQQSKQLFGLQTVVKLKSFRDLFLGASSQAFLSRKVPIDVGSGKVKQISQHITRKAQEVTSTDSVMAFTRSRKKLPKTQLYKEEKKEFLGKKLFEKVGLLS